MLTDILKNKLIIVCGSFVAGIALVSLGYHNWNKVSEVTVGTYGEHIYTYEFNHHKNTFVQKEIIPARNASYALPTMGADGKEYIYTVSECGAESGVYSFERNTDNGHRTFSQTGHIQETGANPCFVMLYECGKYMLTADYTGGSVSAFPIENGAVKNLCASLKFSGHGPDTVRQASSHIHQLKTLTTKSGKWILATDLGADAIRLISAETGKNGLNLTHKMDIPCPAGSGPRHMEFNADSTVLYCLTELSGEVLVYDIKHNGDIPEFSLRQKIQADEVNARGSGDIHIHPSGKWIYTSHRLSNDGIAIFNIIPDNSLEKAGYTRTARHPRNFMITDDGAYLLAACRDDKMIQVFEILKDGSLQLTGTTLNFEEDKPSSICGLQ